eukprot:COSAG04_NODE_8380_length_983_cov_164.090573_2_plen_193_part_00
MAAEFRFRGRGGERPGTRRSRGRRPPPAPRARARRREFQPIHEKSCEPRDILPNAALEKLSPEGWAQQVRVARILRKRLTKPSVGWSTIAMEVLNFANMLVDCISDNQSHGQVALPREHPDARCLGNGKRGCRHTQSANVSLLRAPPSSKDCMPSVKKLAVHVSPYTVASQASEKGAAAWLSFTRAAPTGPS